MLLACKCDYCTKKNHTTSSIYKRPCLSKRTIDTKQFKMPPPISIQIGHVHEIVTCK
ncbi:hypothetical protein Syun_006305 [Stephania yunnanensis]|uniref:Uncharacterized protein n=1 Tax=Stephania yunnanensis TaxID=152371 RepID=A0AAP0KY05_9MAGN